ncbi:MAG: hypothetical protein ACLFUS_04460 [Candidatus Sumerlaeia bacterium]
MRMKKHNHTRSNNDLARKMTLLLIAVFCLASAVVHAAPGDVSVHVEDVISIEDVSDVTVSLYATTNVTTPVASVDTNASGIALFSSVTAGNYYVAIDGADLVAQNISPMPSLSVTAVDDTVTDLEYPVAPGFTPLDLTYNLYDDPLVGLELDFIDSNGIQIYTGTTDSDGTLFIGMNDGTYSIEASISGLEAANVLPNDNAVYSAVIANGVSVEEVFIMRPYDTILTETLFTFNAAEDATEALYLDVNADGVLDVADMVKFTITGGR